jgi:membrane glycosyltransferase
MSLLLAPKLMAWIALLFHKRDRIGCGGAFRMLVSMLLETIIAGLLAPVTMLTQSSDVMSILMGRDSGWSAQRRDDGSMPFGQIVKLYWRHTVFGLAFGGIAWLVSPWLALWMSPVVLGLALAIPLASWTASSGMGLGLRRMGLLLVPEESATPRVLTDAVAFRRDRAAAPPLPNPDGLFTSAPLLEAHRRMLPAPRRPGQDPFDPVLLVGLAKLGEARSLDDAMAGLNRAELAAVLAHADGVARLEALSARAIA